MSIHANNNWFSVAPFANNSENKARCRCRPAEFLKIDNLRKISLSLFSNKSIQSPKIAVLHFRITFFNSPYWVIISFILETTLSGICDLSSIGRSRVYTSPSGWIDGAKTIFPPSFLISNPSAWWVLVLSFGVYLKKRCFLPSFSVLFWVTKPLVSIPSKIYSHIPFMWRSISMTVRSDGLPQLAPRL